MDPISRKLAILWNQNWQRNSNAFFNGIVVLYNTKVIVSFSEACAATRREKDIRQKCTKFKKINKRVPVNNTKRKKKKKYNIEERMPDHGI